MKEREALDLISVKIANKDWDFFGNHNVGIYPGNNLLQLKYKDLSTFDSVSENCRGHVWNTDGKLVALPFAKFYNVGEREKWPNGTVEEVWEKLDGSLIIMFFDETSGWRFGTGKTSTTPGRWDKYIALAEALNVELFELLDKDCTYLWEYTGRLNQHVISYDYQQRLTLLAKRNIKTLETTYANDADYPFYKPQVYGLDDLDSIKEMIATFSKDEEGFVVKYSDGSLWKLKGEEYLKHHSAATRLTYSSLFKFMRSEQRFTCAEDICKRQVEYSLSLPEEYHDLTKEMFDKVWSEWTKELWNAKQHVLIKFKPHQRRKIVEYCRDNYPKYLSGSVISLIFNGWANPYKFVENKYGRAWLQQFNPFDDE